MVDEMYTLEIQKNRGYIETTVDITSIHSPTRLAQRGHDESK